MRPFLYSMATLACTLFVLALCVVVVQGERHRQAVTAACIQRGYPDTISSNDHYYCVKVENGSQIVVKAPEVFPSN